MSIYLGSSELSKIYVGSNEVAAVYAGENLVYPISPKAYYPLESNANDASGKGNNASWVGTASYTTVGGKASAHFTRNNNYINTGLTPGSGPITIACQFYHDTSATYWETVLGTPIGWTSGKPNIGICQHGTKWYAWGGYAHGTESSSITTSINTWHFCAIRIDGSGNVKIALDNNSYTESTNPFNITDTIYIGAGIGNRFSGNVRDVAIWDRSISDEELQRFKTFIGM